MAINHIKKEEFDRAHHIAQYCFPWMHTMKDEVQRFIKNHIKSEDTLGYYDEEGTLMAQVICYPYEIYVDGSKMKMGGIGLVSSMPEGRHGGRVGSLLEEWLKIMRQRRQVVSMLGPFSFEFYRKYGYEIGFDRLRYTIPIEHLRTFKKNFAIKAYKKEDLPSLKVLYDEFAKKHNGCTVRDDYIWNDFTLSDPFDDPYGRYTYVCYDGTCAKGYIIFKIKDGRMDVFEIVYRDRNTLDTLLSFVYSHQAQIREVSFSTPLDDAIQYVLPNPRVERKIEAGMMFRVVDVKAALEQRNVSSIDKCRFTIKITDNNAEWNEKPLEFTVDNGKVSIKDCDSADVVCSIQTFSQIFIGYMTPSQALECGKIQGKYEDVMEMDKVFKKSYTYNTNAF